MYSCMRNELRHDLASCVPHNDDDACASAADQCWHLIDVESAFTYCMEERTRKFKEGVDIFNIPAEQDILAHQNILYLVGKSLEEWKQMYNVTAYKKEQRQEPVSRVVKDKENS